jgi:hypothetical protein
VEAECSFINTQHKDFVGLQVLNDPSKFKFTGKSSSASSSYSSAPSSQPQSSSGGGGGGGGLFSSLFGSRQASVPEEQPAAPSSERGRDLSMPSSPSEREMFQISLLKTLLQSYFGLVRKNLQDVTVKLVWRNVVEKAKNDLQRQLMADLYKPELFDVLMRENPQVHSQRIILKERLAALRQAKEVISLQEVREERD